MASILRERPSMSFLYGAYNRMTTRVAAPSPWHWRGCLRRVCVGDVIFSPNDKISVRNRTNVTWAAIRGAHKIPKKKKQDKGNTRGLIHQRSYAEVAAASA